jgi:hypothetical protein
VNKFGIAAVSFFAYCQALEQQVFNMAFASLVFVTMDTVLACYLAVKQEKFSSRKLRMGLFWKIAYYTGMMVLAYFTGFLVGIDLFPYGAWAVVLVSEGTSMLETLSRINKETGQKFGLGEKFLQSISKALGELEEKTFSEK